MLFLFFFQLFKIELIEKEEEKEYDSRYWILDVGYRILDTEYL